MTSVNAPVKSVAVKVMTLSSVPALLISVRVGAALASVILTVTALIASVVGYSVAVLLLIVWVMLPAWLFSTTH